MSGAADSEVAVQDRSTRLLVCGILAVLAGVCCLGMVPLMLMAMQISPEQVHASSIWLGTAFYAVLGIAAIALGIGSIKCSRWARDLILAGSSLWLALGIPGFMFSFWIMAKTMPSTMSSAGAQLPPAMITTVIVFTGVFYFLLFVAIPLVLVLLYRGESVLQTCNRKSGSDGWTTHLTIPQLACALICLLIFFNTLLLPVFMPAVMVWDQVITGMPAIASLLVLVGLFGFATWGLYYEVTAAWWVGVIGIVVMTLNYGISFYVGDFGEFYQAMGFPEEQIAMIEQSGMVEMMRHMWISMVFYLAVVLAFFWQARPAQLRAA